MFSCGLTTVIMVINDQDHQKCFGGWTYGPPETLSRLAMGNLSPFLHSLDVWILGVSTRCPSTYYCKSAPMVGWLIDCLTAGLLESCRTCNAWLWFHLRRHKRTFRRHSSDVGYCGRCYSIAWSVCLSVTLRHPAIYSRWKERDAIWQGH